MNTPIYYNCNNHNFSLINEDLAYFIGVLHSDGCIYNFYNKKRDRLQIRLILSIASISIPMALKFKEILFNHFNRTVNLRKRPNKNLYVIQTSINKDWHIFEKWAKQKIPSEIKSNPLLFSAYLAGIIDGDGHIQIKHNIQDRVIPQCVIKITSGYPLIDIKVLLKQYFNCDTHFTYEKRSKAVYTCFYVSNKNILLVERYILPHLIISHKINILNTFLKMKKRACRDSKFGAITTFYNNPDQPVRSRSLDISQVH